MTPPKKSATAGKPTPPTASPARRKSAAAPAAKKPSSTATVQSSRKPPPARPAALPEPTLSVSSPGKVKDKLVRDSFTIPKSEYAVLELLKARAANLMRPAKKSEILRAGISILHGMDDAALLAAINAVPSLKTGRPKRAV